MPECDSIEYYDESPYEIGDILKEFIQFSTRGVTIEIKIPNTVFEELLPHCTKIEFITSIIEHLMYFVLAPNSLLMTTETNTSGISEVPESIILASPPMPTPQYYENTDDPQKVGCQNIIYIFQYN